MNRAALIERKAAVRAEIARLQRELTREQQAAAGDNPRQQGAHGRRIAELEAQLEALMAEESSLRVQIDRTG